MNFTFLFRLVFFLLFLISSYSFSQQWPTMGVANWYYSSDGYSLKNFKIDVVNNAPYTIKKIKYKFWIYDERNYYYDVNTTYTSSVNIGPYETGQTPSLPLPNKRYLHYYRSFDEMSWGCEILDVEFYKTPEQIQEEKEALERDRIERERIAREEAERERLRLEKIERDRKRDSLYNAGFSLYSNNKLRESNFYFVKALELDANHSPSLKLHNEIDDFFVKRNGEGYKYRIEKPNDYSKLISEIKSVVNDELNNTVSGDISMTITFSFDTTGNNLSSVISTTSGVFKDKIINLIRSTVFKPASRYGMFLNTKDEISLNLSWNSSKEYIVSNGKGINGSDMYFKTNPQIFKKFIDSLDYKYGNFTFEVKNKMMKIDDLSQSNQNISLIKYKLNAGPQYAFYSLILPGWGSAKVSSGERGYLEGLAYLTGLASAGLFKVLERSSYSDYEDAITQEDAVTNFDSATGSRRLFLISLGLAGVIYVYDFSWSMYRGFKNLKKASEIKKKIKNKPIEVKTSNF